MPIRTLAVLLVLALPAAAAAGPFTDFLNALQEAARATREASGYARTENVDLALVGLEGAEERWREVAARAAAGAPEPFDDPDFHAALGRTEHAVGEARARLDAGEAAEAHAMLEDALASLAQARRRLGIALWSDCILEMNEAMDQLWRWRSEGDGGPDLSDRARVRDILADNAVTLYLYERCREAAPEAVRDGSFARLFEGAIASLQRIPEVVESGETGRFVSILRELRSYDRLLRFRYG